MTENELTKLAERDAILMEVAGWIEEGDLLSMAGILSKRKRDREDANLRIETSQAVRARMADMIRGRMANKVGDPLKFLRDVSDGRYENNYTGYTIREAIALADKGLLTVSVITKIAGPWNNVVGGATAYRIELTDEGRAALRARAAQEPPK